MTAEQIADDAEALRRARARRSCTCTPATPDEAPEWRREAYEAFVPEVRRRCPGVVVCVTTSGRTFGELEKRADVLALEGEAKPDMASLTLGSLNFRDTASVNAPETIVALALAMRDAGIRPELEIFDSGMAYLANTLIAEGLLPQPAYANILLGSANTAPATAADLAHLVRSLPEGTVWAAAGIGAFQLAMNGLAVFMGGHVRTGLEDNAWLDVRDRSQATNAALVVRVAELAELACRQVATVDETRAMLGLERVAPVALDRTSPLRRVRRE